jgi:hypothetical protein
MYKRIIPECLCEQRWIRHRNRSHFGDVHHFEHHHCLRLRRRRQEWRRMLPVWLVW